MTGQKQHKRIYLDYAATTPVDPRVSKAMAPYWSDDFGNPGGLYEEGRRTKQAIKDARTDIASRIGAEPDEIIFTSGGTEANNLAIFGFARWCEAYGKALSSFHFITSTIEHPSVLDCFRELESRGADVSYIRVTEEGILDLDWLGRALKPNTVFVSVMYTNNEIGTLQPVAEIAKIIAKRKKENFFEPPISNPTPSMFPVLHTDASQAPLFYDLNMGLLHADFLVLDAQKLYGPKGVGLLYARRDVPLKPIFYGGKQEKGRRPGTENVPGIVGFAKALEIANLVRAEEAVRLTGIRDFFIEEVLEKIPLARLNGHKTKRLPGNAHISFPGIDNEWLVIQLDQKGIAVGTRSACLSGEDSGSYVIEALGKSKEYAKSGIRFTLGRETMRDDIGHVVRVLAESVQKSTKKNE